MKVEAVYKKRKELSDFLPASERHKLKVIKNPSVNSPARSVVLPSNDNSLTESPAGAGGPPQQQPPAAAAPASTPAGNQLTAGAGGLTGKRRPSEPDLTEADSGMSCDSSRMQNCDVEMTQPPVKRANTVTALTVTSDMTVTSDNNSADGFTENKNVNKQLMTSTTTPTEVETMNCDVEMTQHNPTISRKNNVTVTSASSKNADNTTSAAASITNGNGLEVS